MENKKTPLWVYRSMKKQDLDNDYFFYEDGSILHHYDRTITKRDIEEDILPKDISTFEKELILLKCERECSAEIYEQIQCILITE
jgi:hypothetical protein